MTAGGETGARSRSVTAAAPRAEASEVWPALSLDDCGDTLATLHMWMQVVGKIRLVRTPLVNHWWEVVFYLTSRGLTTSPIPSDSVTFDLDFDFIDHELVISTSGGERRELPLRPRSVADFYRALMGLLGELGIEATIRTRPVEVPEAVPFERDETHSSYDPGCAQRLWLALLQTDRVLKAFRGRFLGKASPVHFFWGSFDLAVTRFSGRGAPEHPGGVPNLGDWVVREAYSHEVSSAGFWPGSSGVSGPIFYSYAYPEPAGFREAAVRPEAATYSDALREFVLPYDAVRGAPDPDEALTSFLQSTYAAAAELGGWDRGLERTEEELSALHRRIAVGGGAPA